MANDQNLLLRDMIDSVQQRPQFSLTGRPTQVVVVAFTTPHGFTGSVTMSLEHWKDPEKRFETVAQAVIDLEGPFWEGGAESVEGG